MTVVGKFKVYFNRHGAAPRVWCIAPTDDLWELAVRSIQIGPDVDARTVYKPKPTADEDDGIPSAWIEVEGQLTVLPFGHATFGEP